MIIILFHAVLIDKIKYYECPIKCLEHNNGMKKGKYKNVNMYIKMTNATYNICYLKFAPSYFM
jgi:hypothetical protein